MLAACKAGTPPKPVIEELSEDMLGQFADVPLVSRYDVYEQLMIYWGDVLQDDVYLISTDGWTDAAAPRAPLVDKARKIAEDADLVLGNGKAAQKYKMDLIPPELVMRRYFSTEFAQVGLLQQAQEAATVALAEFVEEHGVEGGLLEDVVNDKGKLTKTALTAQIKALRDEPERADELEAARQAAELLAAEAMAKTAHKDTVTDLQKRTVAQYKQLTEDEIKSLVIDDKWLASIRALVGDVVKSAAYLLEARCEELGRRYEVTLPALDERVRDLEERVSTALQQMLAGRA